MENLHHEAGFVHALNYYQLNKGRSWSEWLQVEHIFPNQGKQGIVGIFKGIDSDIQYVFKVSQYIDCQIQHEMAVAESLLPASEYCPHFSRPIGGFVTEVNPRCEKGANPFDISNTKYPIEKEVLLMEYITDSHKLCNYLKSDDIDDNVIYTLIKQVMMTIAIGQKSVNLTHYDLHSNNILIKPCSRRLSMLYILDEENQFFVPTFGYFPIIIDYGFSYSNGLDDYLWPRLCFNEKGFTSYRYDQFTDPKLFLASVSSELVEFRANKISKTFRKLVKNAFGQTGIDMDNGWDTFSKTSIVDKIIRKISNYTTGIVHDYPDQFIGLVQSLIKLPLQERDCSGIDTSLQCFCEEFGKIEDIIGSPYYCIYLLKHMVETVRIIRDDYNSQDNRARALDFFKLSILERIDSISQFGHVKGVNFEKMLIALLLFTKKLEGLIYFYIADYDRLKAKHNIIDYQSVEEIYAQIDMTISTPYEFTTDSVVMVVDVPNKKHSYITDLSEENIETLNELDTISIGPELVEILSQR